MVLFKSFILPVHDPGTRHYFSTPRPARLGFRRRIDNTERVQSTTRRRELLVSVKTT